MNDPYSRPIRWTWPHPCPRPDSPPQVEAAPVDPDPDPTVSSSSSQRPGPPPLPEPSQSSTITVQQDGDTHNTNNSSGIFNHVTGQQHFDASSISTLLNCEGTSIQLVVMSGVAATAASIAGEAPVPQRDSGGDDSNHRTEIQRLEARAEGLRLDVEWLMDELQTLGQRMLAMEISNRRVQREVLGRRGRGGEEAGGRSS